MMRITFDYDEVTNTIDGIKELIRAFFFELKKLTEIDREKADQVEELFFIHEKMFYFGKFPVTHLKIR